MYVFKVYIQEFRKSKRGQSAKVSQAAFRMMRSLTDICQALQRNIAVLFGRQGVAFGLEHAQGGDGLLAA